MSANRREIAAWGIIALLQGLVLMYVGPKELGNDSYQYLSEAKQILVGNGFSTELIAFNTERSHGVIPAPLTTFPPGYSVVAAALAWTGLDVLTAARLVSVLSHAGTAAVLFWGLHLVRVGLFVRVMLMLFFLVNSVQLTYAMAVHSDGLFQLMLSAYMVAQLGPVNISWWVLPGLACWVRYAGLFPVAGLAGFAFSQWMRGRERSLQTLLWMLPAGVLIGVLLGRNYWLVGTWRGGNEVEAWKPLSELVLRYGSAHLHLLLGRNAIGLGLLELGVFLLLLVLLGRWIQAAGQPAKQGCQLEVLWWCVATYSVCLIYTSAKASIDVGMRYFLPLLPLYLILLAPFLDRALLARGARICLLLLVVLLAVIHVKNLTGTRKPDRHERIRQDYQALTAEGGSLLDWMQRNIGANEVLFAPDGQAAGYALGRKTVSLLGKRFSDVKWTCPELEREMNRFGSRWLLLAKPSAWGSEAALLDVAKSIEASCGFAKAAETEFHLVLRRQPAGLP